MAETGELDPVAEQVLDGNAVGGSLAAAFGSDMTASLSRLAHPHVVPREIYQTRVMHELDTAAQDYACFTNDLFSYQKEIEFEGEVHNLVLVIENFLGVDRLRARDIVADLMKARMEEFEHIIDTDMPAMFEEHDLDEEVRVLGLRPQRELVAHSFQPAGAHRKRDRAMLRREHDRELVREMLAELLQVDAGPLCGDLCH